MCYGTESTGSGLTWVTELWVLDKVHSEFQVSVTWRRAMVGILVEIKQRRCVKYLTGIPVWEASRWVGFLLAGVRAMANL